MGGVVMGFFLLMILSVFSINVSAQNIEKFCETLPVNSYLSFSSPGMFLNKMEYCVQRQIGGTNPDILFYFHGAGGSSRGLLKGKSFSKESRSFWSSSS